jgi:TonB family protein
VHHVHEAVRLDAIITKGGRVDEVQVLNQEGDAHTETAKHAVAQWVFKPASCSGRTVNTEMTLEINFKLY